MLGQKLLWESYDKKAKFKYVYCFNLEPKIDSQLKNEMKSAVTDNTIYQINSKKKLRIEEIELIMDCVKKTRDENGHYNSYKCTNWKKYEVSIQI